MDEVNETIFGQNEEQVGEPVPQQEAAADTMNEQNDLTHFNTLLMYLQDEFDHADTIPLYKKKKLVNTEMCQTILRDIYNNLPLAVAYGCKLYEERDRVMKNAENAALNHVTAAEAKARARLEEAEREAMQIRAEAEKYAGDLVANAEEHAAKLVDENEITARAREEGRQIVDAARSDAKELRQKAVHDCSRMIEKLQAFTHGVSDELERQKITFTQYGDNDMNRQ